ncbi:hypothetical protein HPB47_026196 [Ixodes persulcatus]|uniref:Uncharacterized protein n=1 Tax=Ixodes persulcatus TaxID=34615 RepID=A0AC60Q0N2_IXOPE|nr:hypothetical protein HPB47_026196 [Ixodes persulcatus]
MSMLELDIDVHMHNESLQDPRTPQRVSGANLTSAEPSSRIGHENCVTRTYALVNNQSVDEYLGAFCPSGDLRACLGARRGSQRGIRRFSVPSDSPVPARAGGFPAPSGHSRLGFRRDAHVKPSPSSPTELSDEPPCHRARGAGSAAV